MANRDVWVIVEDSRGQRIDGAEVEVTPSGQPSEQRTSRDGGRAHFHIDNVVRVLVAARGFAPYDETVTGFESSNRTFRVTLTGARGGPDPVPPMPGPGPSPLPPIPSSELGRWNTNFLYHEFFGPACAAFSPDRRARYFRRLREQGATHVLINADQDPWGDRKGHPEWTAGGYWALKDLGEANHFNDVLIEARQAGLLPIVGLIDQPRARRHKDDIGTLIALSNRLMDLYWKHMTLAMTTWEADEVWPHGDDREDALAQWIAEVDWRGRDVGIHYRDGLRGGNTFYGRLDRIYPTHVVRLMQWFANDTTLDLEARLIGEVAAVTGTKAAAFEHSSPFNQSPTYSLDECRRRSREAMRELSRLLPPERTGSMNGIS